MVKCVVRGCPNRQGIHPVRFFCIPTAVKNQCAKTRDYSVIRRAEWIARINRKEITEQTVNRHTRVCSQHFVQGFPCGLFELNNQDWAPSRNLGYENPFHQQIGSVGLPLQQLQAKHEDAPLLDENGRDSLHEDILMVECDQELSEHDTDLSEEHALLHKSETGSFKHVMEEDPLREGSPVVDCKSEANEIMVEDSVEDDVLSDDCKIKPFQYVVLENFSHENTLISECNVKLIRNNVIEHSTQDVCTGDLKVEPSEQIEIENSPQEGSSIVECKVEQPENYVVSSQGGASVQECKVEPFEQFVVEDTSQKDASTGVSEGGQLADGSSQNVRLAPEQVFEHNTTMVISESSASSGESAEDVNVNVIKENTVILSEAKKNQKCKLYDIHNCCKSFEELKTEKKALLQELESVKFYLSERLAEKNLALAQKDMKIKQLESQIARLETIKGSSRQKFSFCAESFMGDDHKVSYYTGLPSFGLLFKAFNSFSKRMESIKNCVLPKFEQFVMVLVWLRLGLEEHDLGYRFGVCQSTVSRTLHRWLIQMSLSLDMDNFIVWPDRGKLVSSMPLWFKTKLKKSVLILINIFQVFVKAPGKSKAHHGLKFLIATSPQGQILFVSKSWASGSSDKHITEHCGLLEKLLPGDIVMADGGFDGAVDVGMCAKEVIATSTAGKYQLSCHEVYGQFTNVDPKPFAQSVVHQKYKILASNLPFSFSTTKPGEEFCTVDHIVRVCCALANLWSPTAP